MDAPSRGDMPTIKKDEKKEDAHRMFLIIALVGIALGIAWLAGNAKHSKQLKELEHASTLLPAPPSPPAPPTALAGAHDSVIPPPPNIAVPASPEVIPEE